ncbi:hypothetical protein [uncultured Sphingomonas sp.]|uniref:hypothetical protein n=1 Tax=uncultured Sphingomonas sp. TaxID=158754 RepID=UPI0035CAA58E
MRGKALDIMGNACLQQCRYDFRQHGRAQQNDERYRYVVCEWKIGQPAQRSALAALRGRAGKTPKKRYEQEKRQGFQQRGDTAEPYHGRGSPPRRATDFHNAASAPDDPLPLHDERSPMDK